MNRYRDLNTYLRDLFGTRVQKISLDAGFTCPNRDGTLSRTGCIFCNGLGSGTGAWSHHRRPLDTQILQAKSALAKRYGAEKFIAYFQSFTNTYAPLHRLREVYDRALCQEDIVGLAVGTRPDCVDDQVLSLLASYQNRCLVWLEYGLQSAHDTTLKKINRGHTVDRFQLGVSAAHALGLDVCVHVILGLPGEDHDMMMETARYVAKLPVRGIKIHLLYVAAGTALATLYQSGEYRCLTRQDYVDLVVDFLELLPPDLVVHRLTGDPARSELIAPLWALEKSENVHQIRNRLEERDTWQGRRYQQSSAGR